MTLLGLAACGDSTGSVPAEDVPEISRVTVGDGSGHLFWIDAALSGCEPFSSCPFLSSLAVTVGEPKTVVVTVYPVGGAVLSEELRVHMSTAGVTWVPGTRTGNSLTGTLSCTAPATFFGEIELWRAGTRIWAADRLLGGCVNP